MLDYDKSQELMLAQEAAYMKSILEIPGLNADVVAVMSNLYRSGWRDCWMEEAKARLCVVLDTAYKEVSEDVPTAHIEEGTDDVR
jgi:hypothetical protein